METNISSLNNTPESRKAEHDEIERKTQDFLKSGGFVAKFQSKTDKEIIDNMAYQNRSRNNTISQRKAGKNWGRDFKL